MKQIGSILFMIGLGASMAHADQYIRISIASAKSQLTIRGKDILTKTLEGQPVSTASTIDLVATDKGIAVNSKLSQDSLRLVSNNDMSVGNKRYRDELEIRREPDNTLTIIHPLPLETYVAGIVASEVSPSWPMESLKAQAIAARTYAVWQKYRRVDQSYHLTASVLDQVYDGVGKEHVRAKQAAEETYGLVITYQNKLAQSYFHASCGGQTESALDGWGFDLPYLPGSKCILCQHAKAVWEYKTSTASLSRNLSSLGVGDIRRIQIGGRTKSGRARDFVVTTKHGTKRIVATDFRKLVGYNQLKSTLIERIDMDGNNVRFIGRGRGHGVGMCQEGAKEMAEAGFTAQKIIEHFYPKTQLRRFY